MIVAKGLGYTKAEREKLASIGLVDKTKNGLCPQLPDENTTTKFLRQDGTWVKPPTVDTSTLYITAGKAEGTTLGTKATAEGNDTESSNNYSHAEGGSTRATGACSHSEGAQTLASGTSSHAEGQVTTASGNYGSHAEGNSTAANGDYGSHAEGAATSAHSEASHSEGYYTEAGDRTDSTTLAAHSEGYKTKAIGLAAHAEGGKHDTTTCGSNVATADEKDLIASGVCSHAEGIGTTASGKSSHAEGRMTTASVLASHAEGFRTTASGLYSHAEGNGTLASGNYSHAEGWDTTASNSGSHAEGYSTTASGLYSHAEGAETAAVGWYSHAGGMNTVANAYYQTAIGKHNNASSTEADRFIIGKGSLSSAKSNAFRVNDSGVYGAGSYNSSGADYAEMFEWADGNPNKEDRVGRFVTLDGDKIALTDQYTDFILGIVSGNPSVNGDVFDDQWQGMYLKDVFGRPVWEDYEYPEERDEEGNVIFEAHTERLEKLNPDYDGTKPYIPRSERPEWDAVGMLGKLVVLDDGSCEANCWCRPSIGGIAAKADERTPYRVMERIDETHVRVLVLGF